MTAIIPDPREDIDPKRASWSEYTEYLRKRLKFSDHGLRIEIYNMVIIRLLFEIVYLLVRRSREE